MKGRPVLDVPGMTVKECPTQEEAVRYLQSHDEDRPGSGIQALWGAGTIPGLLRASFANPGIQYLSPTTRVSTLTTNIDLLPYFLKKTI